MAVGCMEVTSRSILKPYSPPSSPQHHHFILHAPSTYTPAPPSTDLFFPEEVHLNIFDRAAFDVHVAVLYAYRPPMPTNQAMKDGLSKALDYFPHLSGRLSKDAQGRPCVVLNDAGIRLVEANFPTTLEESLPFEPSDRLNDLHPPMYEGPVDELLQIQLNRFACGGLVIGLTANHRVADGQSMSSFLVAWARLVRGMDLDRLPNHDRATVAIPRSPPSCLLDHGVNEFYEIPNSPDELSSCSIDQLVLHFSPEFITKLKAKVTGGDPAKRCSTFQCLLTHLWKKLTYARGLEPGMSTHVRVAVNGRARMRDVPMEYFGNLVLWAYPRMPAGELLSSSYTQVSDAIRASVTKIDEEYFRSFVDYAEVLRQEGKEDLVKKLPEGKFICPNLEVDSWLSFNFHDLDFGGGAPCAFLPPSMAIEGMLVFVPSCDPKNKGGVDVFIGVMHDQADCFKRSALSLDD